MAPPSLLQCCQEAPASRSTRLLPLASLRTDSAFYPALLCRAGWGQGSGHSPYHLTHVRVLSHSAVSSSFQPSGLCSTRLLYPWDSLGKNTGMHCRFLLQGILPRQGLNLDLLQRRADSLPPGSQLGSPPPNTLDNLYLLSLLFVVCLCHPASPGISTLEGQGSLFCDPST